MLVDVVINCHLMHSFILKLLLRYLFHLQLFYSKRRQILLFILWLASFRLYLFVIVLFLILDGWFSYLVGLILLVFVATVSHLKALAALGTHYLVDSNSVRFI